jgi:hypothetical protein
VRNGRGGEGHSKPTAGPVSSVAEWFSEMDSGSAPRRRESRAVGAKRGGGGPRSRGTSRCMLDEVRAAEGDWRPAGATAMLGRLRCWVDYDAGATAMLGRLPSRVERSERTLVTLPRATAIGHQADRSNAVFDRSAGLESASSTAQSRIDDAHSRVDPMELGWHVAQHESDPTGSRVQSNKGAGVSSSCGGAMQ